MTKEELAESLRQKLSEKCTRGELDGNLPGGREAFLQELEDSSHDNLIAGFLKCSVCGRMSMSLDKALSFARHCDTANDWIKFLLGWRQMIGECRHEASAGD